MDMSSFEVVKMVSFKVQTYFLMQVARGAGVGWQGHVFDRELETTLLAATEARQEVVDRMWQFPGANAPLRTRQGDVWLIKLTIWYAGELALFTMCWS